MFLAGKLQAEMKQLYSGKGAGAAAHLNLKKQARKSERFCFPSK